MTTRRCMSKTHPADKERFYDVALQACPECGAPRNAHNTWLAHALMNAALWRQTERVVREG